KEIYKLGLKHGMQLAAISGVNGVYSDADIRRVRALALERRAAVASTKPPAPASSATRRSSGTKAAASCARAT
ncbi:MAG: hypothetical protein HY901_20230, partial [Deltaproteobacteria bacterium]|nr:hypothetical protein [Deltaproteobacteria bacterium]